MIGLEGEEEEEEWEDEGEDGGGKGKGKGRDKGREEVPKRMRPDEGMGFRKRKGAISSWGHPSSN